MFGLSACDPVTELECVGIGCYRLEDKCNGVPDCIDMSDELDCGKPHILTFKLYLRVCLFVQYVYSPEGVTLCLL